MTTEIGTATCESLCMPFPLRPNYSAQIVVPRDLTREEAERLCTFVRTLVFVIPPIKGKGRINIGASIFQDMHFGKWPESADPPLSWGDRSIDPAMLFEVEWNGRNWDCKADGFGYKSGQGEYGNGSIFVTGYDGVTLLP